MCLFMCVSSYVNCEGLNALKNVNFVNIARCLDCCCVSVKLEKGSFYCSRDERARGYCDMNPTRRK